MAASFPEPVQQYVDAIPSAHRPLFDRLDRLVRSTFPDAEVVLSYRMPAYRLGRRTLYVGSWAHGLSVYGWRQGEDGGFAERHPEILSGKGTIRLTPTAAATLPDPELQNLIRAALTPPPPHP